MPLTEQELRRNAEYADAEAEFENARRVAERAQDESGGLRAELAWTRRSREISDRLNSEADRSTRRQAVIDRVKADHPFVPEALYESILDPDQLEKVVSDLAKEFDKAANATKGWGAPGAGPGDGNATTRRSRADDRQRLVEKANTGDRVALQDFKTQVWQEKVANSPYLASQGRRARSQEANSR